MSAATRTLRQRHEAEVYDARAGELCLQLADADLLVDDSAPPYPNREHVDFLDFVVGRLGDPSGLRILEVGCGSGTMSTYLARRGAHVMGVDVSDGMLALARRRAVANGVSERVNLVAAPVEDLDAPDASFDAVIGNQVLHHLELRRAMPNISRLIGDRGIALFVEPVLFVPDWARRARYSSVVTRVFPSRADTPDERSIDWHDVAEIRAVFARSDMHPFQVTARLNNFVALPDGVFHRLERLDRALLRRVPAAVRAARYVVLVLSGAGPFPRERRCGS